MESQNLNVVLRFQLCQPRTNFTENFKLARHGRSAHLVLGVASECAAFNKILPN
jgi:hypothetical protein